MKKTISITLSGIIFNIEEDGYAKLKDYLDSIREYFFKLGDSSEIMEDIEARAAEKFSERLNSTKKVITLSDVEELVESMGTVEDITGQEKIEEQKTENKSWKDKKLYRDLDNAVLMGVCAGIANYFGIDPVIVRIVFLLSLFFGGAGVLIYIILCFIILEAKTTAQKMEMRGQRVNLTSLKVAAEEKIESAKKRLPSQPIRKIALMLGSLVKKMLRIGMIILGFSFVAGSISALAGISIFFGNLLFNADMVLVNFPEIKMLPGIQYYLAVASGFLTILVPIIFVLFIGLSFIRRRFILNLMASLCLLMVWIISVSSLGVFAARLVAKHEERMQSIEKSEMVSKIYDFKDFNSISVMGNYKLKIEKGDNYNFEVRGHEADFDSVAISQDGNKLEIDEDHRGICIFCYDSRMTREITIIMPELGKFESDGETEAVISGFDQDEITFDLNGTDTTTADIQVKSARIDMDESSELTISGQAENFLGKISGINKMDATELNVKSATLDVDGDSDVKIWATDKLDVKVDGTSQVSYKSDPTVTKKVSKSARLEKK